MIYKFSKRTLNVNKKQQEFIYFKNKIRQLKEEGRDIIDFSIGDPSEPKDPLVLKNIENSLKKYVNTGYPIFAGEENFKIACCEYMKKRFNIDFDYNTEICITNGVKTAVDYFSAIIINDGDYTICPVPTYPPYIVNTLDYGGNYFPLPMNEENNFLIDFKKVPEEIVKKTKIIWINYPNSPTGAVANLEYYQKLTEWAKYNNIIVASDEGSYIDIYYDDNDKPISIFNGKNNKDGLVAFYSLSKRNNMINDRIGFICGDRNLIDKYKQYQNRKMGGVPPYIQDIASIAILDNDYNNYLNNQYRKKFDLIVNTFNSIGVKCKISKGSFYLWVKAPNGMTGEEFSNFLLSEAGIAVIDGSLLSQEINGVDPSKNYVRIALVPLIDDIKKACEKLKLLSF